MQTFLHNASTHKHHACRARNSECPKYSMELLSALSNFKYALLGVKRNKQTLAQCFIEFVSPGQQLLSGILLRTLPWWRCGQHPGSVCTPWRWYDQVSPSASRHALFVPSYLWRWKKGLMQCRHQDGFMDCFAGGGALMQSALQGGDVSPTKSKKTTRWCRAWGLERWRRWNMCAICSPLPKNVVRGLGQPWTALSGSLPGVLNIWSEVERRLAWTATRFPPTPEKFKHH